MESLQQGREARTGLDTGKALAVGREASEDDLEDLKRIKGSSDQTCKKLKPFHQQIFRSKFPPNGKIETPWQKVQISDNFLKISASASWLLGCFCMSASDDQIRVWN